MSWSLFEGSPKDYKQHDRVSELSIHQRIYTDCAYRIYRNPFFHWSPFKSYSNLSDISSIIKIMRWLNYPFETWDWKFNLLVFLGCSVYLFCSKQTWIQIVQFQKITIPVPRMVNVNSKGEQDFKGCFERKVWCLTGISYEIGGRVQAKNLPWGVLKFSGTALYCFIVYDSLKMNSQEFAYAFCFVSCKTSQYVNI